MVLHKLISVLNHNHLVSYLTHHIIYTSAPINTVFTFDVVVPLTNKWRIESDLVVKNWIVFFSRYVLMKVLDDEKGIWWGCTLYSKKPLTQSILQCFATKAFVPDIGLIVNFSPLSHIYCCTEFKVIGSRRSEKINLFWIWQPPEKNNISLNCR